MVIYLDSCCLQRPLDDSSQLRIRLEAEAVLGVIDAVESKQVEIVSSVALELENDRNPSLKRRRFVRSILKQATVFVPLSESVKLNALRGIQNGLDPIDALHLSCAVESQCDFFCTTDDKMMRKAKRFHRPPPRVVSIIDIVPELDK